jgi:hypothetical protein
MPPQLTLSHSLTPESFGLPNYAKYSDKHEVSKAYIIHGDSSSRFDFFRLENKA